MTRRFLITLVLLLAMPLRSFAALAMPCCPADAASATSVMPVDAASPESAMPDHAASMPHDDRSATSGHAPPGDSVVHAVVPACCALAMIAAPALLVAPTTTARLPSLATPRSDPVAAFLTDAPERPPRFPILSA